MKSNMSPENSISRRKFAKITGVTSAGLILGPALFSKSIAAPVAENSKVALAAVNSYDEILLREAVEESFELLGSLGDIIKPGDTVGIKINLTGGVSEATKFQDRTGTPVGEGYWTNPVLLKVVGQLIKEAGAGKLYILEALSDWESFNDFGYKEVTDALGATFIDLNETAPYPDFIEKSVGDGFLIFPKILLNGVFNKLDCFISMPKAKQHATAGVTHGMKNLVGTLPVSCGLYNQGAGYRAGIHELQLHDGIPGNNLCRVILDLNRANPIQLVVNDAIKTVLGSEGPWAGDGVTPATFNKIIIGKDPVAVDSVSTSVMGFNPKADDNTNPFPNSLNYLRLASQSGLGEYDPDRIDILKAGVVTGNGKDLPELIRSHYNYPNPFSQNTTIQFSIQKSSHVILKIYDSTGREIAVLNDGLMSFGTHSLNWDASGFAGGTYYYTLNAGNFSVTGNMLLVK